MRLVIPGTPFAGGGAPSVGIFWRGPDALVVDRSSLDEAEPYGECLTHSAGHYERWQHWQSLGVGWLEKESLPRQISWTEYDDWPRGRVVYKMAPKRFVIYADSRLRTSEMIDLLKQAFGLAAVDACVEADDHCRRVENTRRLPRVAHGCARSARRGASTTLSGRIGGYQ